MARRKPKKASEASHTTPVSTPKQASRRNVTPGSKSQEPDTEPAEEFETIGSRLRRQKRGLAAVSPAEDASPTKRKRRTPQKEKEATPPVARRASLRHTPRRESASHLDGEQPNTGPATRSGPGRKRKYDHSELDMLVDDSSEQIPDEIKSKPDGSSELLPVVKKTPRISLRLRSPSREQTPVVSAEPKQPTKAQANENSVFDMDPQVIDRILDYCAEVERIEQQSNEFANGIDTEGLPTLDGKRELKEQALPVLEELSVQVLSVFATMEYADIVQLIIDGGSDSGKAYASLKRLFDNTKRVYATKDHLINIFELGSLGPSAISIAKKANLATYVASCFGSEDIGFFHLDRFFLDTFASDGSRLLKQQASLWLSLKTQAYFAAMQQGDNNHRQVLADMFPHNLETQLLRRRLGTKILAPSESDFVSRAMERHDELAMGNADDENLKDLRSKFSWDGFLADLSAYLRKNFESIVGGQPKTLKPLHESGLALERALDDTISRRGRSDDVVITHPKPGTSRHSTRESENEGEIEDDQPALRRSTRERKPTERVSEEFHPHQPQERDEQQEKPERQVFEIKPPEVSHNRSYHDSNAREERPATDQRPPLGNTVSQQSSQQPPLTLPPAQSLAGPPPQVAPGYWNGFPPPHSPHHPPPHSSQPHSPYTPSRPDHGPPPPGYHNYPPPGPPPPGPPPGPAPPGFIHNSHRAPNGHPPPGPHGPHSPHGPHGPHGPQGHPNHSPHWYPPGPPGPPGSQGPPASQIPPSPVGHPLPPPPPGHYHSHPPPYMQHHPPQGPPAPYLQQRGPPGPSPYGPPGPPGPPPDVSYLQHHPQYQSPFPGMYHFGLPQPAHPEQSAPTSVLYEQARAAQNQKNNSTTRNRPSNVSQRRAWTTEEETALMAGIDAVKGPHWSSILSMYGPGGTISEALAGRSQVQLKDKARNLKLFFLKSGIEIPYYLGFVTGDLKRASGKPEDLEDAPNGDGMLRAASPWKEGGAFEHDEAERDTMLDHRVPPPGLSHVQTGRALPYNPTHDTTPKDRPGIMSAQGSPISPMHRGTPNQSQFHPNSGPASASPSYPPPPPHSPFGSHPPQSPAGPNTRPSSSHQARPPIPQFQPTPPTYVSPFGPPHPHQNPLHQPLQHHHPPPPVSTQPSPTRHAPGPELHFRPSIHTFKPFANEPQHPHQSERDRLHRERSDRERQEMERIDRERHHSQPPFPPLGPPLPVQSPTKPVEPPKPPLHLGTPNQVQVGGPPMPGPTVGPAAPPQIPMQHPPPSAKTEYRFKHYSANAATPKRARAHAGSVGESSKENGARSKVHESAKDQAQPPKDGEPKQSNGEVNADSKKVDYQEKEKAADQEAEKKESREELPGDKDKSAEQLAEQPRIVSGWAAVNR